MGRNRMQSWDAGTHPHSSGSDGESSGCRRADHLNSWVGDWKVHFKTIDGNLCTGQVRETNVPLVVNLRMDPFERMIEEGGGYSRWWGEKLWTLMPATVIVGQFLETFKEYPPRMKAASFSLDQVMEKLTI